MRITLLVVIFFFSHQIISSGLVHGDSKFAIKAAMDAYVENQETMSTYKSGATFLGASSKLSLSYNPNPRFFFEMGYYFARNFGDKNQFFSVKPLFSAGFQGNSSTFIIGSFESKTVDGLPLFLIENNAYFKSQLKEGLYFSVQRSTVTHESWVDWININSSNASERFIAATESRLLFGLFSIPIYGTVDHQGGELFFLPDEPVRDNYSGATGLSFRISTLRFFNELYSEVVVSKSANRDRSVGKSFLVGSAFAASLGITLFINHHLEYSYFNGNNFYSLPGDNLYQENRPLHSLDYSMHNFFDEEIHFDGGVRFQFLKTNKGLHGIQQLFWLSLSTLFNSKKTKMATHPN